MTIRLEQSIEVSAPVEDAYNVWSQFSNFPDFMGNTHDTEITEQEGKKIIYWQTLKGVRSATTVRFTPIDDARTTVNVHYPNGMGTQTTVQNVTHEIEADLNRFVKLLQGQPGSSTAVGADVLGPAYAMGQPDSPLAVNREFAQAVEKNLDGAVRCWLWQFHVGRV